MAQFTVRPPDDLAENVMSEVIKLTKENGGRMQRNEFLVKLLELGWMCYVDDELRKADEIDAAA